MRARTWGIVAAGLLLCATASAGERRPRIEPDDCSRQCAACERACDARPAKERLSCKTDCRLAESRCRNSRR